MPRWRTPAAASPLVINATPGDTALQTLRALKSALHDKVLLDVSNATERRTDGLPGGLLYPNGSLASSCRPRCPRPGW